MIVIKRDGRKDEFNPNKVSRAIRKCLERIHDTLPENQITEIGIAISNLDKDTISVEEIQNEVVKRLYEINPIISNEYQKYRKWRTKVRDRQLNGKYYDTIMELVEGKPNEVSHENGNKDAKQFNVMRDLIAGETCKKLYKDEILSPNLLKLDDLGIIHIHDKDYRLMKGMTNCCVFNLEDMLDNGTVIQGKMIKTPHSLRTAATVATQIIRDIASSQYGGITMTMSHLAKYVGVSREKIRKELEVYKLPSDTLEAMIDQRIKDEIKDSIQTLLYQLNSMASSNGQAPFITIFCYLNEKPEYHDDCKLIIKELLKQRIEGMYGPTGQNINPAFPKIVYALDEDNVYEGTRDFDVTQLAAKCTCLRMVPDPMSVKICKQYKEGLVIPPMGCRSFLHPWKDENGNYKIYGRLNIGVISLNLPYIALMSKDWDDFKSKLCEFIDLVSAEQNRVYQVICKTKVDVAPTLWCYGAFSRVKLGSYIGDVIKNMYCSASIGYVGIAECVYRFGKEYVSKEGHDMGIEIIKTMYDRANYNKEKYGLALSLYGTPAESLVTKFAKAIRDDFPLMEHVNDRDYIENSYHVPVTSPIDGFSKIDFESEFQKYSLGGAISYVEMPDVTHNPEAVIKVYQYIYDHMLYCELNTDSCDVCYTCGYHGKLNMDKSGKLSCPNCGETNQDMLYAVKRLCGYLGVITNGINKGRIANILSRVKHF